MNLFEVGNDLVNQAIENHEEEERAADHEIVLQAMVSMFDVALEDAQKIYDIAEVINSLFAVQRGLRMFKTSQSQLDDVLCLILDPVPLPNGSVIRGMNATQTLKPDQQYQLAEKYDENGLDEEFVKLCFNLLANSHPNLAIPVDELWNYIVMLQPMPHCPHSYLV